MFSRIFMLVAIQESSVSKKQIKSIEAIAKKLYRKHFGREFKLVAIWVYIPQGNAFVAGKISSGSMVSFSVKENTDNEIRHAFMADFSSAWISTTQCKEHELMLTVMDKPVSDDYRIKVYSRINPASRFVILAKLALKLAQSKVSNGFFSINLHLNG